MTVAASGKILGSRRKGALKLRVRVRGSHLDANMGRREDAAPLHSDLKVRIGGKLKEPRITIAGIILCDCPEFLASKWRGLLNAAPL